MGERERRRKKIYPFVGMKPPQEKEEQRKEKKKEHEKGKRQNLAEMIWLMWVNNEEDDEFLEKRERTSLKRPKCMYTTSGL